MNELKTRGVEDVLIAIVNGLKGFDAGASAYAHLTRLRQFFRRRWSKPALFI
jgi:transposase-like protein